MWDSKAALSCQALGETEAHLLGEQDGACGPAVEPGTVEDL